MKTMEITQEELIRREFKEGRNQENELFFSKRNSAWNHGIKVWFFPDNMLVEIFYYDKSIPCFGCKNLQDLSDLQRLVDV